MTAVEAAASAWGLLEPTGEAAASVRRVGFGVGKGGIRKKRCRSTKAAKRPCDVKREVPSSLQLQRLFLACRQVFKGPGTVPSQSDVDKLCQILDGMMPEDVGLSSNLQFFNPNGVVEGNPRVTNTTIYSCDNFSLCIFFLPTTAVIPLHNHPGMTVFSKLLLGSMHIKAYDWVDEVSAPLAIGDSNKDGQAIRLARLKANQVFTAPCSTSVLYPTSGGNIHEFKAVTPCAVLDVLGPPYSEDDGRDCSHYRDIPYDALSSGKVSEAEEDSKLFGWLEEIEIPEESKMYVIQYKGPQDRTLEEGLWSNCLRAERRAFENLLHLDVVDVG
nr:plant cysteine oxidase 2-like [Ipomoea batatas]